MLCEGKWDLLFFFSYYDTVLAGETYLGLSICANAQWLLCRARGISSHSNILSLLTNMSKLQLHETCTLAPRDV